MEIGVFIIYIVKVSIYMSLFYAFNKLLLSKETLHQFNRLFWLFSSAASFVLPLIVGGGDSVVGDIVVANIGSSNFDYSSFVKEESVNITSIVVNVVFILYCVGFVIMLFHNIFIHTHLLRFIFSSGSGLNNEQKELVKECEKSLNIDREIKYVVHTKDIAPFSWFNYVVMSRDDFNESGKEIITHELAHISQYHSIDLLIVNIITIFQWFNPTSWLIRRELKQVHEYLADDKVISIGINIKNYQLLLIKKAVGSRLYSMSNSLNHSNLKNRITMMTQKKSERWSAAKSLYILPLALCTVSVFANPNLNDRLYTISEVKISNNNLNDQIETEVASVAVTFADTIKSNPIIIVDGLERSSMDDVDPSTIKSVNVLKGESATAVYGEKGKNGVVIVTLKSDESSSSSSDNIKEVVVVGYGTEKKGMVENVSKGVIEYNDTNKDVKIIKTGDGKDGAPLVIVDGKEVSSMKDIDASDIESISVLKDESATEKYGEKGKNGVILVTLKK